MKSPSFLSTATKASEDLLIFDNTYRGYSFPRHFHERYLVEMVEAGPESFYCHGSYYSNIHRDSLVLINPGEVHTGGDNSNKSEFRCKVFYPALDAWEKIAGESFEKGSTNFSLRFTSTVSTDARNVASIKALFAACETADNEFLVNELYQQVMIGLMERHTKSPIPLDENARKYEPAVKRSLEYIQDNFSCRLLLADISRSAFVSPYHFLRIFKKLMGLSLHQYVLALRVDRAKYHLQKKGSSIEDTYMRVGFTNQSHFTKVFRKMTGLTPGQYQLMAKN